MLVVLHRMALSSSSPAYSFFTSSLRLSSINPKPSSYFSFHSPVKTFSSISNLLAHKETRGFNRRGLSTISYVATDSSETAVVNKEDKSSDEVPEEKIVLPTNQSSEKLLRIRHTVNSSLCNCICIQTKKKIVGLINSVG